MSAAFYALLATLAAPLLRLLLRWRAARGKEIPARLAERFGRSPLPRPAGRLVWLHAASLGETQSLLALIAELEGGAEVLLTTGTPSSAALAQAQLPGFARHQFVPLDVPRWVGRFLAHWRPDVAVFVESELWPEMLRQLDARRIPRFLLNAGISERSARRWARAPGLARRLLGGFAAVHAQSARDAAILRRLGADPVLEWGNLKLAAPALPVDAVALTAMRAALPGPSWLAASTHPGEEAIVIAAHRLLAPRFPDLVTVIVPRHPERGAAIAALAAAADPAPETARRSLLQPPPAGGLYIADTLGELGLFYRLSMITLVGGSLVDIGGHNLAEPARLGAAMITGPFTREIDEQVRSLRAAAALVVAGDAASLAACIARWLEDPVAAVEAGGRALSAFDGLETLPARLAKLLLEPPG